MKILCACNAFKGTLSGAAASLALKEGFEKARPGSAEAFPGIADGGDGLVAVLRASVGGRLHSRRVSGPLGRPVSAHFLMLPGRRAVIEMSEAAGLRRLGGRRNDPMTASTRGVGELMSAAARAGAKEIFVGLGGSASNDAGAGCAAACGWKLLDAAGRPVPDGAAGLLKLARVEAGPGTALFGGIKVTGLADVTNPLCGPRGSARVYGPQKGATPSQVRLMERAMSRFALAARRLNGAGVARLPGGAAAGGLGAGLAALFGASLTDGAAWVLENSGFAAALAGCGALATGEGRFDRQTLYGKAPAAAARLAAAAGKPVFVFCGEYEPVPARDLLRLGIAA
ncbi:MAG: glycerate kinase, partial [Elusimicrobiales bacterium]|nr:glycerate kinase [Elusimicrobiales bacterium]